MLEHAFNNGFGTFPMVVDLSLFSVYPLAMSTAEPELPDFSSIRFFRQFEVDFGKIVDRS